VVNGILFQRNVVPTGGGGGILFQAATVHVSRHGILFHAFGLWFKQKAQKSQVSVNQFE
jgi:hypothetical protein